MHWLLTMKGVVSLLLIKPRICDLAVVAPLREVEDP